MVQQNRQGLKIAFVTPWFGADLIGGAERLAWHLSHSLARANVDVEVLTTCCRSFHDDWSANYHRPGTRTEDGVTVRRFKVDARDRVAFSRANSALLALRRDQLRRDRAPLPSPQTQAFVTESIRSKALLRHLQERGANYDALMFSPYLYGTTLQGLPLVADRAFLMPCLHDEAYAYLDAVRDCFRKARGLLFNSDGELHVAAELYGPWVHFRSAVIGHAIDVVEPASASVSIRGFVPQRSRYLLFLGRGDRTKNIDLALEAFARFRESRRTTSLQFVIAGPHATPLRGDGVVDLGAVTEEQKASLLAHARALVQPSTNESFSFTVHEAWHFRRPVVVHADCPATAEIVRESGGGWLAGNIDEWANAFAAIDESSDADVDGIGMRGRAVVLRLGSWDEVAARALALIGERLGSKNEAAILPLEQWSGPRAQAPCYDDGALNMLSIAPLEERDAENVAGIVARIRRKVRAVRLFVFDEDCSQAAKERLALTLSALGLSSSLVVLGDDTNARFAALRDGHVAFAFSSQSPERARIVEAMWFDLPIVAHEKSVTTQLVSTWGILCDADAASCAALVAIAARDAALRRHVVGQLRQFRRIAPKSGANVQTF